MQFLLQANNAQEVPSFQPARRERSRPVFIGRSFQEENPESMAQNTLGAEIENAHDDRSTRIVVDVS